MRNYSRQRETVLRIMQQSRSHPTAAQVYEQAKKELPHISLGTVYRNLCELNEAGDIFALDVGDGQSRFDGNISPHLHLHCHICGMITDVPVEPSLFFDPARKFGFYPEKAICVLKGVCQTCRSKAMTEQ